MSVYRDKRTKSWCYKFKRKGVYYHRCFKDASYEDVCAFETVAKSELIKSNYDIARDNKIYTLSDIVEDYRMYAKNVYSKPQDAIKIVERFLKLTGNKQTNFITVSDIEKYRSTRKNIVKNSTINREIDNVKRLFSLAKENKKIKENPCQNLKDLKIINPTKRYLDKKEENKLLSVANPIMRSIIIFAIHTGMRSSEIKNLKWSDVFLKENYIVALNTKNGKSRELIITPQMKKILKQIPHLSDYVFTNPITLKPYVEFKRTFKRTVIKAGIAPITFHELRHTTASRLNELGIDLATIQEYLDHSDARTTQRYIHKPKKNIIHAIENLAKY